MTGELRTPAIPRRTAVAEDAHKPPAVRAAPPSAWIDVPITDTASAQRLAEETP